MRDDEGPLFELRPDCLIETPAGTVVLDTKWKTLDSRDRRKLGVSQGDVYQMLNYGQAYDAKRLVLLYPWHSGLTNGINRTWAVVGTNRRLEVATVDVGEPSGVIGALREMVRSGEHSGWTQGKTGGGRGGSRGGGHSPILLQSLHHVTVE